MAAIMMNVPDHITRMILGNDPLRPSSTEFTTLELVGNDSIIIANFFLLNVTLL
jgi:hypothetical protein